MTVDAKRFADIPDFVGKTNFQRVKTVAHILNHLSSLH